MVGDIRGGEDDRSSVRGLGLRVRGIILVGLGALMDNGKPAGNTNVWMDRDVAKAVST